METYLIKIKQLIPQRLVEHRSAPFGGNDDPAKFSRPRQPRGFKIGIVDFEVMLEDGSLVLGLAVGRREEVLGVVVVVHLLEAGRTKGGQEEGHDDEVAGMLPDHVTQFVEPPFEGGVYHFVLLTTHFSALFLRKIK